MKTNKNLLIACTGSVATIKLPVLLEKLQKLDNQYKFNVSLKEQLKYKYILLTFPNYLIRLK